MYILEYSISIEILMVIDIGQYHTYSTTSFVPHLKIPKNPKIRFCSLKWPNHPYYFSPSIISSDFNVPSHDSLTERLLKMFLFNNSVSGLVKEMAAK